MRRAALTSALAVGMLLAPAVGIPCAQELRIPPGGVTILPPEPPSLGEEPMPELIGRDEAKDIATDQGLVEIRSIEREGFRYQIRGEDQYGYRVRVTIDARDGRVIEVMRRDFAPHPEPVVSETIDFRLELEPYGEWVPHRRWGEVWVPRDVPAYWRPYRFGRWVYTEEWGWFWLADEEWGWIPYHYGRWILDPALGWAWVPGREWGPAWVRWRRGEGHIGWSPLPPDELIVKYDEIPETWTFVRTPDLLAHDLARAVVPPQESHAYLRGTVVVNETIKVHGNGPTIAVNPGIPPSYVAAATGRALQPAEVRPKVLPGTTGVIGAVAATRASGAVAREVVRPRAQSIQPANTLPPPTPLPPGERGRLGAMPPTAAQPGSPAAPALASRPATAVVPAGTLPGGAAPPPQDGHRPPAPPPATLYGPAPAAHAPAVQSTAPPQPKLAPSALAQPALSPPASRGAAPAQAGPKACVLPNGQPCAERK